MSKDKWWTKKAKIIFLIGAPRSGTTWLQAMLASHPCVSTGPETHFFEGIKSFVDSYYFKHPRPDGLQEYMTEDEFFGAIAHFFHKVISKMPEPTDEPKFFLEKTPQHSMFLDIINKCFPEAYFIHIIRDPRNVVSSILRASKTWGKGYFPKSVLVASLLWKKCVLSAKEFFLSSKNTRYFEIKYEDLRNNPIKYLSKIFSFLDLSYDKTLLDNIIKKNDLREVKSKKKFESIIISSEPEGFFGQANIENINSLSRMQNFQLELVCGDLMYELGYISNRPNVPFWARILCSYRLRRLFKLQPI